MVAIALLALVADLTVELWLPDWQPRLHAHEALGIDLSAHQGLIDWPEVSATGISFAYLKATEGATFIDTRYPENAAAAGLTGIATGAYAFFTLCSPGSAQAKNFLRATRGSRLQLPPALDLELAGNCTLRPPVGQVRRQLADYLGTIRRPVLLYVGRDFADRYSGALPAGSARWQRSLFHRPTGSWRVWQANDEYRQPGVDGRVDLDVSDYLG